MAHPVVERAVSRHAQRREMPNAGSDQPRTFSGVLSHDVECPEVFRTGTIAGEDDLPPIGRPADEYVVRRVLDHHTLFAVFEGN